MSAAPTDAEIVEALEGALGSGVKRLSRRPYAYATSAPLEEVRVVTVGGELTMILKDLSRERLLGDARTSKPALTYEPRREIDTYQRILGPSGIGPRLYASVTDGERSSYWLLIEKVQGVELWQIGEFEIWEAAAEWLGRMHAQFQGRTEELREASPHLLDHTPEWYRAWCERAISAVKRSGDQRAPALVDVVHDYDSVAARLATLPRTLIHGELYPANLLIVRRGGAVRVVPIDWEMAGVGPGVIDIAALSAGWADSQAERLVRAYAAGRASAPAPIAAEELSHDVARARLHLALQWLGWGDGWTPPPEHANDWLAEALEAAERLDLA